MKKPAVFLDRDGTLIEEVNFLSRVEDLQLFPYTLEAITLLKSQGFLLIVVTNQSGIGRGHYTEHDMHAIHDQIQIDLAGAIDGFYYCPHLPDAGCECRKPGNGMIKSAQSDFEIDIAASWMVGDKKIDVQTGRNQNMRSALVLTGYGLEHRESLDFLPEIVANTLLEAAKAIITANQKPENLSRSPEIIV